MLFFLGIPGIPNLKMRLWQNKDGQYCDLNQFKLENCLFMGNYGEIPLHLYNINGLKLYLPSDIHGYVILC